MVVQCAAGALVRDGTVLLVKRSRLKKFYPDVWDLFGGHVEGSETLEEALPPRRIQGKLNDRRGALGQ